eukprot:TRINITY_DN16366_c0_g1_i1.p1 TRINITY_DN16366_c0_g1~~TRINITY_DN16366_c0_g1_i1.p1  ORF type:complete len:197 (+),score=21.48 TRINITY_DN16366_c0_g1_i1:42-632(+)
MDEATERVSSPVDKDEEERGGAFECNICLGEAKEPVVTSCGHLYCWPCIYKWTDMHRDCMSCPVCKAAIKDINDLIPLYIGGNSNDPRKTTPKEETIPHRPTGRRNDSVPVTNPQRGGGPFPFHMMDHSQMWRAQFGGFGIGIGALMPFFQFQTGGNQAQRRPLTPQQAREQQKAQLSTIFIFLGLFLIFFFLSLP